MRPMNRRNRRSENNNLLVLLDNNANKAHRRSRRLLGSDSKLFVVGSMELQNTVGILEGRVLYILLDTPLRLHLPEPVPVFAPLVVVVVVVLPSPLPLPSPFPFPLPLPLPPSLPPIDNDNTSIYHRPNSTFLSCADHTWASTPTCLALK